LFLRVLTNNQKCNRPTVFAEQPLLTNDPIHLRTGVRVCLGIFLIPSLHPIHLRVGIRVCCLILTHYSCRSRSPVSSEARNAISDFTASSFEPSKVSLEKAFRLEVATFFNLVWVIELSPYLV